MTETIVIALWDFSADQSDELSFKKGDAILVLRHKNGFYRGQLGDKKGWFQDDYVRKPTPEELAQIQSRAAALPPPATPPPAQQPTPRGRQGRPDSTEMAPFPSAPSPLSKSPVGDRSLSGYSSSPNSIETDRQSSASPTPAGPSRSGEMSSFHHQPQHQPLSRGDSVYGLYRPATATTTTPPAPSVYVSTPISLTASSPPSTTSAYSSFSPSPSSPSSSSSISSPSFTSSLPSSFTPVSTSTSTGTSTTRLAPSSSSPSTTSSSAASLPSASAPGSSSPSMSGVKNHVIRVSLRVEKKISGAPAFVSLALDPAMTVADVVQYIAKKISFKDRTVTADEVVLCVETKKLPNSESAWPHRNDAMTLRVRKSRAPPQVISTAVAQFSYSCPERTDVLAFEQGAVLLIHHKLQAEWWIASLNGKRGLIPAPYVKEIDTPSTATSSASGSSALSTSPSSASSATPSTPRTSSSSSSASPSPSLSPASTSRDSSRSPSGSPLPDPSTTSSRLRSGSSPVALQPHPRFTAQHAHPYRHSTEFTPIARSQSVVLSSPLANSDSTTPTPLSISTDGALTSSSSSSSLSLSSSRPPEQAQPAESEPSSPSSELLPPPHMQMQPQVTEMQYMQSQMHGWWPNAYNPYMSQMNMMYPGMAPVMGAPFFNPYYSMNFAALDPHAQQQLQQLQQQQLQQQQQQLDTTSLPSSHVPASPDPNTVPDGSSPLRGSVGSAPPTRLDRHNTFVVKTADTLPDYLRYERDLPTVIPLVKHTTKERREQKSQYQRMLAQIGANDPSLTRLRLLGCRFSTAKAKNICAALLTNTCVSSIDLSHFGFASPEDVLLLLPVVRRAHSSLNELVLRSSGVSVSIARKFEESVRSNFTLCTFVIFDDDRSLAQRLLIDEFCAQNRLYSKFLQNESNVLHLAHRGLQHVDTVLFVERMTELDLGHNLLTEFPSGIERLVNLVNLKLNHNQIAEVPATISALASLESLELQNNVLCTLPEALDRLSKLTYLDIACNSLISIPPWLPHMLQLEYFYCNGNKLKGVPKEYTTREQSLVLPYLRQAANADTKSYRMKIITVGQGNVGKTSLLAALTKGVRQKQKRNSTWMLDNVATDGIDIVDVQLRAKATPDQPIDFSCWDFAGQEVYYSTHAFFMSSRAVYLLTFDLTVPDTIDRLTYWLEMIKARAPNSPVMIVGTHLDDSMCTEEYLQKMVWNRVRRKFSSFRKIWACLPTSSRSGAGMPELIDSLVRCALEQPYIPEVVPATFLALEKSIKALSATSPTLPIEEFRALCSRSGVHGDSLKVGIAFLVESGTICYFPELNADIVILHPQWLADVFSTIITLKNNFVKNGLLDATYLTQIWRPPTYPQQLHPFLCSLLEKFDLVFPLSVDDGIKYFVPALLPDTYPDPQTMGRLWPMLPEGQAILGREWIFTFLPLGFFSRIVVRFQRSFPWTPLVYWQTGLFARHGEHAALFFVRAGTHIILRIRGPQPGNFLASFCESVDTLVSESLQLTKQVVVPCSHCLSSCLEFVTEAARPYHFALDFCEQAVADNRVLMCRGITPVSVAEVAPDIALTNLADCQVSYAEFDIHETIGMGGYATVYRATLRGHSVALKKLQLSLLPGDQETKEAMLKVFAEFRREVQLMASMRHRGIVALEGIVLDPFCIALEFMDLGNLYDFLHDSVRQIDWPSRLSCAVQIAEGMNFIHSMEMIHRDLKSPNVLLKRVKSTSTGVPCGYEAKIADFGLTRKLLLSPTLVEKSVDNPVWLAPEILLKKEYDQRVDVYAFGIILFELLTREDFFGDCAFMSLLETRVIDGERPPLPESILLPEYDALIRACWDADPAVRPPFSTIVGLLGAMLADPRVPPVDPNCVASLNLERTPARTPEDPSHKALAQELAAGLAAKKHKKPRPGSVMRAAHAYVVARALYDFAAQKPDEISMNKGDMIHITEMDDRFLKGLNIRTGQVGWFQADFVERLDEIQARQAAQAASPNSSFNSKSVADVLTDDSSSTPVDEQPAFIVVAQVSVAASMSEESSTDHDLSSTDSPLDKRCSSPAQTTTSSSSTPTPSSSSASSSSSSSSSSSQTTPTAAAVPTTPPPNSQVIAIAKFVGQRSDMLSFEAGTVIQLVEQVSQEWCIGILNGSRGLFPKPYTKPVE